MDESTLNSLIHNLETSRSSLDWWLGFWTCLVVIGVAFELIAVIGEYLADRKLWTTARTRAVLSNPEKPSISRLIFDLLGVVLVVAGVAGELFVQAKVATNETDLRNANGRLVLLLEQEAGDAKHSATGASEAAKQAKGAAAGAEGKAEVVGKKADKAEKTVEAVGKKASVIEVELGTAQDLLSDRQMRDADGLKKQLSKFGGRTTVFRSYANDGDGYFLCEDLLSIATEPQVGIIGTDQCGMLPAKPPFVTGISVSAPDDDTMLSLSNIMARVAPFGVSTTTGFGNGPHPSVIVIFIGRKPWGRVGAYGPTALPPATPSEIK